MKMQDTMLNKAIVGFSSLQLKLIALVCMTIDHLAVMGPFQNHPTYFQIIGRIAAPLFLFILVQSIRYTRNRVKFIKRLYLAGLLVGLFDAVCNLLLGDYFGIHTYGNIFFTYFYVTLYIELIEKIISSIKNRDPRIGLKASGLVCISLMPCFLYILMDYSIPNGIPAEYRIIIRQIWESIFPSVIRVEYTVAFVVLGIIMYFAKIKIKQCFVFFAFCMLCLLGAKLDYNTFIISINSQIGSTFFNFQQCFMILALPFMALYNGERGLKCRLLFYWYYPIHRYLLSIISKILYWLN